MGLRLRPLVKLSVERKGPSPALLQCKEQTAVRIVHNVNHCINHHNICNLVSLCPTTLPCGRDGGVGQQPYKTRCHWVPQAGAYTAAPVNHLQCRKLPLVLLPSWKPQSLATPPSHNPCTPMMGCIESGTKGPKSQSHTGASGTRASGSVPRGMTRYLECQRLGCAPAIGLAPRPAEVARMSNAGGGWDYGLRWGLGGSFGR